MDELRPDDVAARVAAWHNRHPLARRITPAQVQGVGWVALPFVQRPGAAPLAGNALPTLAQPIAPAVPQTAPSLRERALQRTQSQAAGPDTAGAGPVAPLPLPQRLLAGFKRGLQRAQSWPLILRAAWQTRRAEAEQVRARRRALKAAYSEDFIAPLSGARTAGWALRHGRLHPNLAGQPVREVLADPALVPQDSSLTHLYLATAAVELGSRRVRVLLGALGPVASVEKNGSLQVIGPRLISPQRASSALAGLALATLVLAQPMLPPAARISSLPAMAQWPGVATLQAVWQRAFSPQPMAAGLAAGTPADAASAVAWDAAGPDSAAMAEATASSVFADAETAATAAPGNEAGFSDGSFAASASASASASAAASAAETTLAMAGKMPVTGPNAEPASPSGSPVSPVSPASTNRPPTPNLPPDDPPPRAADAGRKSPWVRPLVAPLVATLDEATKDAVRQEVADLRAARGISPPAPQAPPVPLASRATPAGTQAGTSASAQPAPAAALAAATPPAQAVAEIGPSFALTTRPLRTRAESEQVQAAVRALLASHTTEPLLVELMPAGDDWRVVCWPFMRRQDAQLARALLLSRGLRLEAVEF